MTTRSRSNVNVTLDRESQAEKFRGKSFPCPVCGRALAFRIARTRKPYCHCDSCAIQIFFRGQTGIQRLLELLDSGAVGSSGASRAVVLYNRLQQLKVDERDLQNKQGFLFRNADLDTTIMAVQKEIDKVRSELQEVSGVRRKQ